MNQNKYLKKLSTVFWHLKSSPQRAKLLLLRGTKRPHKCKNKSYMFIYITRSRAKEKKFK